MEENEGENNHNEYTIRSVNRRSHYVGAKNSFNYTFQFFNVIIIGAITIGVLSKFYGEDNICDKDIDSWLIFNMLQELYKLHAYRYRLNKYYDVLYKDLPLGMKINVKFTQLLTFGTIIYGIVIFSITTCSIKAHMWIAIGILIYNAFRVFTFMCCGCCLMFMLYLEAFSLHTLHDAIELQFSHITRNSRNNNINYAYFQRIYDMTISDYDSNNTIHVSCKSCSICFTDYVNQVPVKVLPCNHIFHTHCIDYWLVRNHILNCPTCRRNIFDNNSDNNANNNVNNNINANNNNESDDSHVVTIHGYERVNLTNDDNPITIHHALDEEKKDNNQQIIII